MKSDSFRIIDHELCFRTRLCLFPKAEPWRLGSLEGHTEPGPNGHVFGALLKGDRHIDMAALRPLWMTSSDDALEAYGAAMPAEWGEAREPIGDALAHLKAVRDRIDECLAEVKRTLT